MSVLTASIYNLDEQFSTAIARHRILPRPDASLNSTHVLKTLIAGVDTLSESGTDRESQVAVFKQLIDRGLRAISQKPDAIKEQQRGALYLLGALLHRYFRLIKSYDKYNAYFLWGGNVTECRLFKSLRVVLQLPVETLDNYRTSDLEALDAFTVVSALEYFQTNMLAIDSETNQQHYTSYPHLAADPNFIVHLDTLIKEHQLRGVVLLNQFKAINFLQSLVLKLNKEHLEIDESLKQWLPSLRQTHPDFSQLNIIQIKAHIEAHAISEPLKRRIIDLVQRPYIRQCLPDLSIERINNCNASISSYIIMGACFLIFELNKSLSTSLDLIDRVRGKKLSTCISELLESTDLDDLDIRSKQEGLMFLRKYLDYSSEPSVNDLSAAGSVSQALTNDIGLDLRYFGGLNMLREQIARIELELAEQACAQIQLSDNELVMVCR